MPLQEQIYDEDRQSDEHCRGGDLRGVAGATRSGDPTKVAAAAVLVALPILVVYLFLQRHFVRGMLAGAIKE